MLMVQKTLSLGFDDRDARLACRGYSPKALAEPFDARPVEIHKLMQGKLDSERTQAQANAMRKAGWPVGSGE